MGGCMNKSLTLTRVQIVQKLTNQNPFPADNFSKYGTNLFRIRSA